MRAMAEETPARSAVGGRGPRIAASALMTIAVLAAGGLGFWRLFPFAHAPTGYRAYLAASGEPLLVVDSNDRNPPATVSSATEGFPGTLAALPRDTAARLSRMIGSDVNDVQLERSFSTQVNSDGSILALTVISLVRPDGYSVALTTTSDGNALTYLPPRTELPGSVMPGASWTSNGVLNFESPSVRRDNRFTYQGSIAAAEAREGHPCIAVVTALDQRSAGADPYVRTVRSTWCAGRGSVESVVLETAATSRVAAPGAVRFAAVKPPAAAPVTPGQTLASPFLAADIAVPPVVLGRLVISTSGSLGDLDAVRPGPDGQRVKWIQHPGGEVLGLAADDSLVFLTTSRPNLMAFDAAGRIHWLTRLPDAAVGTPICADGLVVVTLLDGTLRAYDSATGQERWKNRFDDTIAVPPVAAGDHIISADTSGLLRAVGPDGEVAWDKSLGPVRAPMTELPDGGVLVQDTGGTVYALDGSGRVRWTTELDTAVSGRGAVLDGDVIAVPIGSGVTGLRLGDGASAWRREGLPNAKIHPAGWVAAEGISGRINADGVILDQARRESGPDVTVPRRSWPIVVGEQALVVEASGAITAVGHV